MPGASSTDFKEVKVFFDKFAKLSKTNEEIRSALLEIGEHNKVMLEHCRAINKIIGKYFPDVSYSAILYKEVKDLPLHTRTRNCLANGNILTVEQLVRKREDDLRQLKNFGKKSLTDLKERIAELGLSLGMTAEDLEEIRHGEVS